MFTQANSSGNFPEMWKKYIDECFETYVNQFYVKTPKTVFPLRPIISQIPTPIYSTTKTLNNLIIPYLPVKYKIISTDDFLDIIRATDSHGTLHH